MVYEYEEFIDAMRFGLTMSDRDSTDDIWKMVDEVVNKAKAFDEVKEYALSKNKDFEDRKDTARSNKEFDYFNTLQIANRAIINKCKQLEDKQNGL